MRLILPISMTAQSIISIAYGLDVIAKDDPYITIAETAVYPLTIAVVPGAFLVDAIPALKYTPEWIPGASFKKKAKEWNDQRIDMIEIPFAGAKEAIVRMQCFAPMLLVW